MTGTSSNNFFTECAAALPRAHADLATVDGSLGLQPEDFRVDEVPLYEPSGDGQHLMLHIEKRQRNTAEVVAWLRKAGLREIGSAGKKDRHAVTRQFFTVERRRWNDAIARRAPAGIEVLAATPHHNKLKTGHLRGNRFRIRLTGAGIADAALLQHWAARLERLGFPNYFGEQRFGKFGDNAARGLSVLQGQLRPAKHEAKFLLSALQSEIFNRVLARRIAAGTWRKALNGDVLKKTQTGGMFLCDDVAADQQRLEGKEVVPTGPLFGAKMMAAEAEAGALEQAVLHAVGLPLEAWQHSPVSTAGSRRPLIVYPENLELRTDGDDLFLSFFLPKGSYATVLLWELTGKRVR